MARQEPRNGNSHHTDEEDHGFASRDSLTGEDVLGNPEGIDTQSYRVRIDAVPSVLLGRNIWLLWRNVHKNGSEKPSKVPFQVRNPNAKALTTKPSTWAPFEDAIATQAAHAHFFGLGIVLDGTDVVGIDLDDAVTANGEFKPWAQQIITTLNSYTEYSPSRRGVHILVHGNMHNLRGNRRGNFEMYYQGRYLTITGDVVPGTPTDIYHRQAELERVHSEMFSASAAKSVERRRRRNVESCLRDNDVLEAAFQGHNGDEIQALWEGDLSRHDNDHSRADLALASHLSWWSNYDAGQADRLFRRSKLFRPKWDAKRGDTTYGELTMRRASEERQPGDGYSPPLQHDAASEMSAKGAQAQVPGPEVEGHAEVGSPSPRKSSPGESAPRAKLIAASDLMKKQIDPVFPVVDSLIVPGLNVLAGRPKTGKSFLALGIAVSVAVGGDHWGHSVRAGRVVYYALEDSEARLKSRLEGIVPPDHGTASLSNLSIGTELRRLDSGGMEALEADLIDHPDTRLVIIDTFARIKPHAKNGGTAYDSDSHVGAQLQDLSKRYQVAVLLVTHQRKREASDPIDTITGSLGLPGTADAILILVRTRGTNRATLTVTGRDIEEAEHALEFHTGHWERSDRPNNQALSRERQLILSVMKPQEFMTVAQITRELHGQVNSVRQLMPKMVADRQLLKIAHGKYTLP